MRRLFLPAVLIALIVSACSPSPAGDPLPGLVAATLTALPSPTPYPTYTPFPSSTPLPLDDLFCEYAFCMGHPSGLVYYDAGAVENPNRPGNYTGGKLVGYSQPQGLFILIVWQQGELDEQQAIETVAASMGDALTGGLQAELYGPYNVFYRPIDPTPQSMLRAGLAAAWRCGDRTFAWKIYTDSQDRALDLLRQALSRFVCEPPR